MQPFYTKRRMGKRSRRARQKDRKERVKLHRWLREVRLVRGLTAHRIQQQLAELFPRTYSPSIEFFYLERP